MNSEYKSALFLSIKIGYLSSFQKQAANSLVTETLQYFVFFCRSVCSAILAYTARHTWATLAKYCHFSEQLICDALGHSSTKVTETYLKSFKNDELNKANKVIIKYINFSI